MSGDGRQALRDEIRISDGNCLYRIDDHLKVIYRSAYPGYDAVLQVLAFGKIPSSSILRAKLGKNPSAGNFTPADWHINYIRPSQLNGIPVDQIDLVRSQSSQVYSSMFLDHSDWTLCRKIELFNSQSANLSHEKIFEDFSNAKSSGAMYPLKTTIITYDSNGTESSRLIIQVTSVDTQPHFAPDQFTIDRPEYADYKIQEFEGAVNPLKNCPHKK
jgi:hypothetical protein